MKMVKAGINAILVISFMLALPCVCISDHSSKYKNQTSALAIVRHQTDYSLIGSWRWLQISQVANAFKHYRRHFGNCA